METIGELIERIIDTKIRAENAPVDRTQLRDMIVELDRKLREFESCKLEKRIEEMGLDVGYLQEDIKALENRVDKIEND